MVEAAIQRTERVALVTGCGKPLGIGGATVRRLARDGVTVVAADLEPTGVPDEIVAEGATDHGGIESLADEVRTAGGVCTSVLGDVSREEDAQRMVEEVVGRYGRLDILVNAAGAPQGAEFRDLAEVEMSAWDRVLAINLTGTFLMCRSAVPHMRAGGWGRIVNVASLAAVTAYGKQAAYSASKAGVLGLTRSLALDVAKDGITVNAISPGWIHTDRTYSSVSRVGDDVDGELRRREERVPVRRLGHGADVAELAGYLASDGAAYITGQNHIIDGGLLPL